MLQNTVLFHGNCLHMCTLTLAACTGPKCRLKERVCMVLAMVHVWAIGTESPQLLTFGGLADADSKAYRNCIKLLDIKSLKWREV